MVTAYECWYLPLQLSFLFDRAVVDATRSSQLLRFLSLILGNPVIWNTVVSMAASNRGHPIVHFVYAFSLLRLSHQSITSLHSAQHTLSTRSEGSLREQCENRCEAFQTSFFYSSKRRIDQWRDLSPCASPHSFNHHWPQVQNPLSTRDLVSQLINDGELTQPTRDLGDGRPRLYVLTSRTPERMPTAQVGRTGVFSSTSVDSESISGTYVHTPRLQTFRASNATVKDKGREASGWRGGPTKEKAIHRQPGRSRWHDQSAQAVTPALALLALQTKGRTRSHRAAPVTTSVR
jgi:hypothetical protein